MILTSIGLSLPGNVKIMKYYEKINNEFSYCRFYNSGPSGAGK